MKIKFHYTYLIVAISFVLTGYFSNLLIFTSIIVVHELGHYLIAKMLILNPIKITIYPFGGITTANNLINTPIAKNMLVAVSGILFQSIYFFIIFSLYKCGYIREYIFNLFVTYHYSIMLFNILPIHPLDGSIILDLLLSIYLPYKITLKINVIISIITGTIIIISNYYQFNYTTILIISIVVNNIIKYYKNINYLFNKFLLERYLYKLSFSSTKNISKIDNMYLEKYHIIHENNAYLTEKQVLKRRFNRFL